MDAQRQVGIGRGVISNITQSQHAKKSSPPTEKSGLPSVDTKKQEK